MGRAESEKYDCGRKRQYRRDVWSFIDQTLGEDNPRIPRPARRVLVLESSLGGEVEELLRRGYNSSNIHVVNHSAAIVATVQRKFKHDSRMRGSLVTHGRDLQDVVRCMPAASFDAISLDFMSCVHGRLLESIAVASSLLRERGVIAITVQRGRETGRIAEWLTSKGDGDPHRADALRARVISDAVSRGAQPATQNGCQWHPGKCRWGAYQGSRSSVSMLWVGMQVINHGTRHAALFAADDLFLPACILDTLQRKGNPIGRYLYVAFVNDGTRAGRVAFKADSMEQAMGMMQDRIGIALGDMECSEHKRPRQLEVWAHKRRVKSDHTRQA